MQQSTYLKAGANAVAEGFGLHSCCLSSLLDFQAVFIRASVEIRGPTAAPQLRVSRDHIRNNTSVEVTHMWHYSQTARASMNENKNREMGWAADVPAFT